MVAPAELLAPPTEEELSLAQAEVESQENPLLAPPTAQEILEAEAETEATPVGVGLEAAASGSTAGLSDLALAASRANIRAVTQAREEGLTPGSPKFGPNIEFEKRVSELGKDFLEEELAKTEAERQAFPTAATVGEVAGALSPIGPAAAAFRGGAAAAKLGARALPGISRAAGTRLGEAALTGAGGTAAFAGLEQAARGLEGKEVSGKAIGEAAETGGAIGAGLSAIPVVGRGLTRAGKAGVRTFFGVREETVNKFLQRAEQIKKSPGKEEIKDQVEKAVQDVQEIAQREQLDTVDATQMALDGLKQRVVEESAIAREILGRSGARLSKRELLDAAEQAKRKFFIAGRGPVGEASKQAVNKIENFENVAQTFPDELGAIELKQIIKQLDGDINFIDKAGGFSGSPASEALTNLRRSIDSRLKEVPEYKAKMEEVADLTRFLNEASKQIGTPQKAFSALGRLGKPNSAIKDKNLERLAKESDIDLERFRRAQQDAQSFKNWTGQSVESKIKGLMNERSIEIKRLFERLSKMSERDFIQQIDDLSVKSQFEQEFLRGSRNVNLWTVIGAGSGFGIGAGPLGAMGGAVIGGVIDKHGPQIAMQMLGQIAKIKGMPTVQKIRNLSLPDNLKQELVNGFQRAYFQGKKTGEPVEIPNSLRPSVTRDIVLSDHLSPSEKADMVSLLNKKGSVRDMDRILGSGEDYKPEKTDVKLQVNKPKTPPINLEDTAELIRRRRDKKF